jgi:hypothetical protein
MLHQKFDGSLMTQNTNSYAGSVSNYELNAVYEAQHWRLEEDGSFPGYPEQEYVEYNMKG